MKRWHCYWLMLIEQASVVAWLMGIIVAGITVWGFILSPWIGIVAVGFALFIIVMGMSFVIFAYGFNSITGVNMTPHILEKRGNKIICNFADETQVEINCMDIRPYKIYPGGVLVPVVGEKAGWLWIPPKAFESDQVFRSFLQDLYAGSRFIRHQSLNDLTNLRPNANNTE